MSKNRKIDLLNSEGTILEAVLTPDGYVIYDKHDSIVEILDEDEMQEFVHGNMSLFDSDGKEYLYSNFPGTMKPDLKELDDFIGIDTRGKVY